MTTTAERQRELVLTSKAEGLMPLASFLVQFGVSRTQAYRHIADGSLVAKKVGRATSLTFSSIREWYFALPEMKQRARQ